MKKKYIFLTVGLILALLTTITFLLFDESKKRIDFKIETTEGKVAITNIRVGQTRYRLSSFAKEFKLKNEKDFSRLILKEGQKIEFQVTKLHDIEIILDKKHSDGKVEVLYNKKSQKLDLTKDSKNNINYYGHIASFTKLLKDKFKSFTILNWLVLILMISILTFIYYAILKFIASHLERAKENQNIKIRNIIILYLIYFVMTYFSMLPVIEKIGKWYFIVIVAQLLALLWYFKEKLNYHTIFLYFAIILSVNMNILLPPLHVPDEYAHYLKAYSLFNKQDLVNRSTIKLYDSTKNTIQKYKHDLFNKECKLSVKEYFADYSVYATGSKNYKQEFKNTASINPFAYLPSALIIKLSLSLKLPFIWSIILARMINALIFVLLGYMALKIIPYFKRILFLIMLFPITIQQTTAVNQDSITLSLIFIYVALIFREIYGNHKKISTSTKYLILILSLCIGMCKPAYFPLALLTILIPKERFNSEKEKYLLKILPIILCLGGSASKYLSIGENVTTKNAITFSYGLRNPIFIIKLVLKTMYQRITFDLLEGQLNVFGWLILSYEYLFKFIIPFLYLNALCIETKETEKLKTSHRLFIGFLGLMIFGIIYASGIFSFGLTTIYDQVILGFQARYFIPVTLLLFICISNNFIKFNIKNKNLIIASLVILTYAVSFYTIILGSYA